MSELGAVLAALVLIVLIVVEFPIAFAFAAATIVLATTSGRDLALILPTAFWQTGGFALLALPLFIIAGIVMRDSRISDHLVASVERVLGRIQGSLGAVTVGSCMLFGAISGSGAAAIAAIGSVMVPKMTEAGYDRGYATALVACSSVLALLIPPSIPMIVFALTAGLPVSACFLSTVGPGLLIGGLYIAMNRRTTRQQGVDRPQAQRPQRLPGASLRAVPALLMPVLMLGGIYSGAFTPTEAAAVALTYGVLVGLLLYRSLGLKDVARCFVEGGAVCASVIAILIFLLVFGKLLALEQIPGHLSSALLSISDNYYVVLLMINVVLLIIGMFLDDISGSILAAVILLPVAKQVGVDPIHFAAIVGTNLGLGNVTPPCAPLLFEAGSVTGLDLHAFLRPALRLMLMGHLPVVLLVTYVPALGTLLPGLLL